MIVSREDIVSAVNKEYEAAKKEYGPLSSTHEGYAVLLEEVEELGDEFEGIEHYLDYMWSQVKANDYLNTTEAASCMRYIAIQAACEAVQVAAVCQRIMDLISHMDIEYKKG